MPDTPRMRSAFPATPTSQRPRQTAAKDVTASTEPGPTEPPNGPSVIPTDVIDHGTQRIYAVALYGVLNAWRFYEAFALSHFDGSGSSAWSFGKFAILDSVFIWGLPQLQIPLLQWSSTFSMTLLLVHLVFSGCLMHHPGYTFQLLAILVAKPWGQRELALAERSVNPARILDTTSLILGTQTIHVLPEGSVTLNPTNLSFCVGNSKPLIEVPVAVNLTNPTVLNFLRRDLDGGDDEIISFNQKQIKSFARSHTPGAKGSQALRHYAFPIRKSGLYEIVRVLDKAKQQVRHESRSALVVRCPDATLHTQTRSKCRGDLSNIELRVSGVPPLQIRYSKSVEGVRTGLSVENVQPDGLQDNGQQDLQMAQRGGEAQDRDLRWARSREVIIPLNETLNAHGEWLYTVEEIRDGLGNVAKYNAKQDGRSAAEARQSGKSQSFEVFHRPEARIVGCSLAQPLNVASGSSLGLPVRLGSSSGSALNVAHHLSILFTPATELNRPSHEFNPSIKQTVLKSPQDVLKIREPGLYQLADIRTDRCSGDILEPSSCLLANPPKPDIVFSTSVINDSCAGRSVGLLVNMELVGTPPFTVSYLELDHTSGRTQQHAISIPDGLRYQLRLEPSGAGKYSYDFNRIRDAVYGERTLGGKDFQLSQAVQPRASAKISSRPHPAALCQGEIIQSRVELSGEAPWKLEYEIVHPDQTRIKLLKDVASSPFTIETEPLLQGGEYTVALIAIQDSSGCKYNLAQHTTISVRRQSPTAAFATLGGAFERTVVAGTRVQLPLRLSGNGPWTIKYQTPFGQEDRRMIRSNNDLLSVTEAGQYTITGVEDSECFGSPDPSASTFYVKWVAKPELQISGYHQTGQQGIHVLDDVCQGDESSVELRLKGSPPFSISYDTVGLDAPKRPIDKTVLRAGSYSTVLRLDTSTAGRRAYRVTNLADYNYQKHRPDLRIEQRVHEKPQGTFVNPHHIHQHCRDQELDQEGPLIRFVGKPPFQLELSIHHSGTSKPETLRIPNIATHEHRIKLPHRLLSIGQHSLVIEKVTDSQGCFSSEQNVNTAAKIVVSKAPNVIPDDHTRHVCVGERVSYSLSGSTPFIIDYKFDGLRRQVTESSNTFRRLAERPGNFTIISVTDAGSVNKGSSKDYGGCKSAVQETKIIHSLPSVKISRGLDSVSDIKAGGEVDLEFSFEGSPPFEFTYTRSEAVKNGGKTKILETRHDHSETYSKIVKASDEGVYEVIAVRDAFCIASKTGSGKNLAQPLIAY